MPRGRFILMLPIMIAGAAGVVGAVIAAPTPSAWGPTGTGLAPQANDRDPKIKGDVTMVARTPQDVHRLWGEAMNAGDLEAVVALYEPEASVVAQPGQVVSGTTAIRETVSGLLALKPRVEIAVRDLVPAGDLAELISPWTFAGTGPDGAAVNLAGTTSDVVRRQKDGTWRFVIDNPFGSA